jgi:hypothetical protein
MKKVIVSASVLATGIAALAALIVASVLSAV